jgi:hypothetical protein
VWEFEKMVHGPVEKMAEELSQGKDGDFIGFRE